jgi:hypothetical protein
MCIDLSPVLDSYQFSIIMRVRTGKRENARVFCSPGFYLRNTTSLRKKEKMAMLRIKVCMNIIFIVSDIYAHFLIPKKTKFTRSLLKINVCEVNKTLPSLKVKYVYVIQNRKYTGGTVQEKSMEHRSGHILSVLSVLCNPNGTLFQTCFNFTCMVEINNLGVCKYLKYIFPFFPIFFY